MSKSHGLPDGSFDKIDGDDDLAFYAPPRLVTHIDENALAALQDTYRSSLPNGARMTNDGMRYSNIEPLHETSADAWATGVTDRPR